MNRDVLKTLSLKEQCETARTEMLAELADGDWEGLAMRISHQEMSHREAILVAGIMSSTLGDFFFDKSLQEKQG